MTSYSAHNISMCNCYGDMWIVQHGDSKNLNNDENIWLHIPVISLYVVSQSYHWLNSVMC